MPEKTESDALRELGIEPEEGITDEEIEGAATEESEAETAEEPEKPEEPAEKAPEKPAEEPEPEAEGAEEEPAAKSMLERAEARLREAAAEGKKAAVDPDQAAALKDEINRRLEQQRAAYEQKIAEMDQRIAGLSGTKPEPRETPVAERLRSPEVIKRYMDEFGVNKEGALKLIDSQAVIADLVTEERTKPLFEKRKEEEQQQQVAAEAKAASRATATGLTNLARQGGTERELVEQFLQSDGNGGYNWNSYLGKALLAGFDPKSQPLPPRMKDAGMVEAVGQALARTLEKVAGSPAATSPAQPATSSSGLPARGGQRPTKSTKEPEPTEDEETAAEMAAVAAEGMSGLPLLDPANWTEAKE